MENVDTVLSNSMKVIFSDPIIFLLGICNTLKGLNLYSFFKSGGLSWTGIDSFTC